MKLRFVPIRTAAIALTAVLCTCIAVPAAVVEVLPNGLTLAVEENRSAPVASVRFYVKVGSVYEGDYLGAGISHFVEHCVSEGTPTLTKEQIDTKIESLGNNSNAYTSSAETCYYITTAAQYVIEAAELLADYVFNPIFPMDEVKTQRGIVLREIAMGDDDPGRRIWNLLSHTMFTVHPARYRVIGYEKQFEMLQRADLVAFHAEHYVPENIVVVVVGDFDGAQVLSHLRELLSQQPRAAARRPVLPVEPTQVAERRRVEIDENLNRAYLFIGWPTVDLFSDDLYALDVAAYLLGHGPSSRLVLKLREELGLVDAISAISYTPVFDAGMFAVRALVDPEQLAAAEAAIAEQIAALSTEPVPEDELAKVRTQKAAEIIYAQETVEGRASVLGSDLINTGDAGFSRLYVDGIRNVTAEDVMRVAARYLRPVTKTTAVLGPPAVAAAVEMQERSDVGGQTVSKRLDNGLLVVVQEAHHSPTVSMLAGFKGGVRYETEETNGLSNLTAQMLVRGTESRSHAEIARTIDSMAASLSPFSGRNTFGLQAQCTADTVDRLLELFADCIIRPSFPPDELLRQQQLILSAIEARGDDVNAVAMDLLAAGLYRQHPYRMQHLGSGESVSSLGREQVMEFHDRYCRPNGMVLAVLGDVVAEEMMARIEAAFADFEIGEILPPPIAQEPADVERIEESLTRAQQQAIVVYGFPGPTITAEDRYARDVMTAVLAGMPIPGGRLHTALRGAELVYATWSFAVPGIETGHYLVYAGTHPDKVDEVKATIEQTIAGLIAEGPSEDELRRGKSMAISAQQLSIQSNLDRAQMMVLDELYNLGFDNYRDYADNIDVVTAAQVREVAAQTLDIDRAAIVVTTPR